MDPGGEGGWRLEARHARPWPGLELRRDALALRLPLAAGPSLELRAARWLAGPWREEWADVGLVHAPALGPGVGAWLGGEQASWAGSPELRAVRLGVSVAWAVAHGSAGGRWQFAPGQEDARALALAWGQLRAAGVVVRLERQAPRWGGGPRWRARWSWPLGAARLGLGLERDGGAVSLGASKGAFRLGLRWELLGPRAGGSELGLRWSP